MEKEMDDVVLERGDIINIVYYTENIPHYTSPVDTSPMFLIQNIINNNGDIAIKNNNKIINLMDIINIFDMKGNLVYDMTINNIHVDEVTYYGK